MINIINTNILVIIFAIISFGLIFLFVFFGIQELEKTITLTFPQRLPMIYPRKLFKQKKKKKVENNVPYIFSEQALEDANIETPPNEFFISLFVLYVFLALVVEFTIFTINKLPTVLLFSWVGYTAIFLLIYVTYLKFRKVNFAKKMLRELPDITNTLLSVFTRTKNSTVIDAIVAIEEIYPYFTLTKYFREVRRAIQQAGLSPANAFEEMASEINIKKIHELLSLISIHNQTSNPIILSHIFDSFVESIVVTQKVVRKAESDTKHFISIAVLVSIISAIGIVNSIPNSRGLIASTQAYSATQMVNFIGLILPVFLVVAGFFALLYVSLVVQEKVIEM